MVSYDSDHHTRNKDLLMNHNIEQILESKEERTIENGGILASNDQKNLEESEDEEEDIEYLIKEQPHGYVSYERNNAKNA